MVGSLSFVTVHIRLFFSHANACLILSLAPSSMDSGNSISKLICTNTKSQNYWCASRGLQHTSTDPKFPMLRWHAVNWHPFVFQPQDGARLYDLPGTERNLTTTTMRTTESEHFTTVTSQCGTASSHLVAVEVCDFSLKSQQCLC